MKLLLILFYSLLSISAQSSLDKDKILLEKLILETKKSLYNSTFEIAKQECSSSKSVSLKKCYQDTLDFSKEILTQYKKEATVVIQEASRNTLKYFSLQKDGTWRLDGQKLEVKDGAEMNIKILQSELQKKWQETIQKVGNPKGKNLQKRWLGSWFRGAVKGASSVVDDAARQGAKHADDAASQGARHANEVTGASSRPVDHPAQVPPNGRPPAAGPDEVPFSQALDTPPNGKPDVPPAGKIDEATQMAELHKDWLKLSFKRLFETRIAKVMGVVFAGIGLYNVMKFFFGKNEELPTFDEGSATFPDPFANDGSTVTFDDSQMDPFQQTDFGAASMNSGYASYGGYEPGYASYGGYEPGYASYGGYDSGYANYGGYDSGYASYGGYETGYGYNNYDGSSLDSYDNSFSSTQDPAFQEDFATAEDAGPIQQYDDIHDPETGYYWIFDPQANAYYRLDDVTYERIYFLQ